MNHVACWLWYYETCEEFDKQVCQDPHRPSRAIQVMVPPHLRRHLSDWHVSEMHLILLNAKLRRNVLPAEARLDGSAMREALRIHDSLDSLPPEQRAEARLRYMPGYDTVAPELEEVIFPTEPLLQLPDPIF